MSARFTLFSAATAALLAPLLYDAAIKGVLLLTAAGLVVLGLRRASAAARHLVWLVAVVALVAVPVLTVTLPRWRVLPAWTAWPEPPENAPHRHLLPVPGPRVETGATAPPMTQSAETTSTNASAPNVPLPERPGPAPSLPARVPVRAPAPTVSAATWAVAAWTAGFLLLSVRLLAAHCLLRRTRRRAEPCPSGPLAEALAEAAMQLGVRSPVSLRLDARSTIPLVWGVLRPCLLLPAEARDWSRDQLRSVLLHELAHLKRRDPLVQALAQVALALHWFNPLAWLAAWRLHVERERACDDLVLASGVRSSEYATHLLRVATELTPAPWTSACGLAMARRSSLEARLRAVLNDRCNRRSMTRALTAAALLLSLAVAIPVAMLRAADDTWNPPNAAHIVTNTFSAYCVHGVKDAAFILAYPGQTSSSSTHDSNVKTRTWTDTGTFTAIQPDIAIGFFRQHTAPDTLVLTTTPASARYLSKPAPPPRPFGQKTFDLTQGRVFLLSDNATIRQLDLPAPLVTDTASAEKLAALIAALPPPAPETQSAKPTHESAQSLFQKWQSRARTNGQIPGALIRQLSRQVTEFIKQYPDTDEAKKLATLRPRFEAAAARDWGPAEAAGLLDDVAAITTAPLDWSSLPMEFDAFSLIKTGEPLPAELTSAAWGPPAENGLRAAWLLEPRAEQYALGTVLNVRVLFHNTGTQPVVFRTETWHQSDTLTVRDAQGADVKTTRTWYTGITPLANYRLLPGEYCEVSAPGVAIGAGAYEDERGTGRLGIIIEAKEGDELALSCLVDAALGITFSRPGAPNDPLELWKNQVADRIASEAPLPHSPADREQLIRRVLLDLTGEPPTAEEIQQFVADPAPNALDTLTARLQAKEPTLPWTGKLPTGTTQFRVLAADPEAAKAPRSANGPGRYVLGDSAHLLVRQITEGGKRTNAAEIVFSGPDPKKESPHPPFRIELADGLASYGIVWERGAGTLWVMDKERLRRVDFANPAATREVNIRPGSLKNLPPHLQSHCRTQ
jgi:beta-lactamase regulating signal transducer with metallopeptidase domain